MKLSVLLPLISIVFTLSLSNLNGQSAFQNAITTNYFNSTILSKSAIRYNGMFPYDGIGKQFLLNELSSTMVSGYTNTLTPTDYINPSYGNLLLGVVAPQQRVAINLRGSTFGELDGVISNKNHSGDWKNTNLVNLYNNDNKSDRNEDSFRDLSTKQRFFGMTNHVFEKDWYQGSFLLTHLNVNAVDGQVDFDKSKDFLTTNNYGFGQKTEHTSLLINQKFRLGEIRNYKEKHAILFKNEGRWHNQNAFYGVKELTSREESFKSYLGYRGRYTLSDVSVGLIYRHQNINIGYSEQFNDMDYLINRWSAFANYNTFLTKHFKLKTFLRVDRESGNYEFYPNVKLNVILGKPNKRQFGNLTLFAGREKQLLLPIAEYQSYFNSSRTINFPDLSDSYYEKTRSFGASYQLKTINLNLPYFLGGWDRMYLNATKLIWKTIAVEDFLMANIIDGDATTTGSLTFSRLNTEIWNHIFEANTDLRFDYNFRIALMYRYNDFSKENLYRFYPKHLFAVRPTYNRLFDFVTISLGYYYQSSQLLNDKQDVSGGNHRLDLNTSFQIEHLFKNRNNKNISLNVGINNLTNNYEQNSIIGAENPFGSEYDGSLSWKNTTGFNAYFGLKMKFN